MGLAAEGRAKTAAARMACKRRVRATLPAARGQRCVVSILNKTGKGKSPNSAATITVRPPRR